MASVDLKDAHYNVSVVPEHRKIWISYGSLNFIILIVYLYGLAGFPRFSTKLTKPVFADLRSLGFLLVIC